MGNLVPIEPPAFDPLKWYHITTYTIQADGWGVCNGYAFYTECCRRGDILLAWIAANGWSWYGGGLCVPYYNACEAITGIHGEYASKAECEVAI